MGTIGGIVTGLSLPALNVLFGRMINALNNPSNNYSDAVAELCIQFVVIAGANIFSGFAQVRLYIFIYVYGYHIRIIY